MKKSWKLLGSLAVLLAAIALMPFWGQGNHLTLPPMYPEKALFENALAKAKPYPITTRLTGLIVPHHLLARQLSANAFATVASPKWKRVIILGPDHFHLGHSPISVVDADFATPFGTVSSDTHLARILAKAHGVTMSNAFYREHGFGSLLPFIKHELPNAKVCAIAIKANASKEFLDGLIEHLKPELDERTLIVQSTDFSHYLPASQAESKDAESREIVRYGSPENAFTLRQPGHIDSVASLYLQSKLQQEVFHSRPVVLDHLNSQHYAPEPVPKTTSYFVVGYEAPRRIGGPSGSESEASLFFAGDVMLGREVEALMQREGRDAPFLAIAPILQRSAVCVANLEGPIVSNPVHTGHLKFHFDPKTAVVLAQAGFTHLGLANNHGMDQGLEGLRATRDILHSAKLIPMGDPTWDSTPEVERAQVGTHAVLLLTLNATEPYFQLSKHEALLRRLRAINPAAFLVVTVHWGHEFRPDANPQQETLGRALVEAGADLIVGHHPHVVQNIEQYRGKWIVFSLGNFVFDQWIQPEAQRNLLLKVTFPASGYRCELIPVEGGHAKPRPAKGDMRRQILDSIAAKSSPEIQETLRSGILLGRKGEP